MGKPGTVTPSDDGVKARHDKMVGLVDTMLKLHKDLPKAKTPQIRCGRGRMCLSL
jgi:hypothetical protein